MGRFAASLVTTLALLVVAAPVSAAPGWTATFPLANVAAPPAMAPDGTIVFPEAATVDAAGRTAVQVRPPGGPLGSVQLLDQPGNGTASFPSVAVAGDGRFIAAWVEGGDVKVAEMAPGATSFGPPISLTDDTATFAWVDADAAGNATVAWTSATPNAGTPANTDYRLRASLVPANGGTPTTEPLDALLNQTPQTPVSMFPVLGVNPSGGALIVWTTHVYSAISEQTYLRAVVHKPGDSFGPMIQLDSSNRSNPTPANTDTSLSYPALAAIGDGGDIGALWTKFTYTGPSSGTLEVDYAAASAASPWSNNPTPDHPITPGELWTLGELAIDPQGRTTFTFNRYPFANATVRPAYVFRPRGGPWASVQELGASAGNTFGLTVAPDGTEMLTYAVGPGDVYAAVAPPGGSFAGQHLFAPGLSSLQGVDSAIGATGDGVVAWRYQSQNGTGPYVSDAAGYDASPPVLNKLTVPSSGTVGDLLSFSVEPFDIWGPVTTSWAFGDGATGDGRSVTHSYSTAGDMTAAVTATDSVGNATTASRPVSIANPPVTNQQQSPVVSQSPAPAVDTTKPVVTGFAAVPSAFAVGKKGTALAAKVHRGTTFRFRLSEPASVAIAIARQIPGLRKGASCVPATAKLTAAILRKSGKRGLARARCKAFKQVGTLTRTGTAGDNTVAFTGKLGRRALGVGRYRATLVATDAAGNSSLPAVASFRIVPAR